MVQNMSGFYCPNCNHHTNIFGEAGVLRECAKHNIEFLGGIPLDAGICHDADRGKPTVISNPASPMAQKFLDLSSGLASKLDLRMLSQS